MASDNAQILASIPNSGVVQMPGRRYPAVVIQGDTLSQMFDDLAEALKGAKLSRDEESYYAVFAVAERFQHLLSAYEEALAASGHDRPYPVAIATRLVSDDFVA